LDLFADLRAAGESDDLHRAVDYADVCRRVMELGTQRAFRLVEAIAESVAAMVLEDFDVRAVRVFVQKTTPAGLVSSLASLGTLDYFGVEIVRTRERQ
jgi:dihydroneopterin aldolase